MLLLASKINPEKYQIQLVCSDYKQLDEWVEQWKKMGLGVHRLNVMHKHDPRHATQLLKILQQEEPDLLHLHLWNPGACRYAFKTFDTYLKQATAKNKNPKLMATEHDPFPLSGFKRTIKKKCLSKTNHTITVSHANQELMLSLYPELKTHISTIHNGLDLNAFNTTLKSFHAQDYNKIRHETFHTVNKDFVILSIAALHPRKGLHYLLEAFALLAAKKQDIKLIIAGEGPQKKELEKFIKRLKLSGKVEIIGHQDNIPFLLKSSDLFVLPSIKEAFGLVLLESMAAGLAIVASAVGGIPEIIEHEKNGILVEPHDTQALQKALLDMINSPALREKIAYVNQNRVKQFDIMASAQKTEQLYAEMMTQSR